MSNLLRDGADFLARMQKAHCSSQVTYEQDGDTVTVYATWGKKDYEIVDETGLMIGSSVIDFLIAAADLGFEPEPGDTITADSVHYEVMPVGQDIRGWRWSDSYGKVYRIHTRHVDG